MAAPAVAPALYTPDDHLFAPSAPPDDALAAHHAGLDDAAFREMYDIDRTVREIVEKGYRRVALQFPDELLGDSTRVYGLISQGMNEGVPYYSGHSEKKTVPSGGCCGGAGKEDGCCGGQSAPKPDGCKTDAGERRAFILADTSYSACCIDEIAAEHCGADAVVHYGRSCLSPTTRLPVIYVFTRHPLSLPAAAASFTAAFPDKDAKVILMADITYHSHLLALHALLAERGYTHVFPTALLHDPSSPLPNRTLPPDAAADPALLSTYTLFHISPPLPSLLLVLASRVAHIHTYHPPTATTTPTPTSTLLRRRYALLTHARTARIIGILANTLNVRNYLPILTLLQRQIRAAGRKSYLVVVGKANIAKLANFAEVDVWVGVGCWEQGIVGSAEGREFYKPVITPFELGCALRKEVGWGGEWVVDFETLLRMEEEEEEKGPQQNGKEEDQENQGDSDSDEDEPPEFDLRTGRYISVRTRKEPPRKNTTTSSSSLINKNKSNQLSTTGGVVSPAADFLRENRSWRGLGSDLVVEYEKEGAVVEVGRSGVARGYTLGGEGGRR